MRTITELDCPFGCGVVRLLISGTYLCTTCQMTGGYVLRKQFSSEVLPTHVGIRGWTTHN